MLFLLARSSFITHLKRIRFRKTNRIRKLPVNIAFVHANMNSALFCVALRLQGGLSSSDYYGRYFVADQIVLIERQEG